MKFFRVEQSPSFPELEKKVGIRWKEEKTFEQSLERTKNGPEFIFYDGPPFPTGSPHHGTLFVTILKDLIPRYKTMRGHYVPRGWGWDCHGLPVETQAEKNLGITDKTDIEKKIGVKAFNDECRRIVSECNEAWKIYIERIGRWVDFDHPYRTLDRDFMESVIWAFSESYRKGFIYRDYRVSPYCYRCQTALSISDTRLDDSTRPRQERTITVKFPVLGKENTYFLAWTTTPWTLPSNLALAVGANISYSIIKAKEDIFILATDCIKAFEKELGQDLQTMEEVTGAELINRGYKYRPIFPYFESKSPEGFPVLIGDFVATDEGTGIVHIAPAFGEDDYWLCKRNGVTLVNPVDGKGCFSSEVTDFEGKNVHDANPEIIRFLKDSGIVLKEKTVEHNYPHCWRCRMPLIYRALDAWYYNIDAIKGRLLANNEAINWYPATVKEGRFGNWIENARDWNITRNRYWATPIPVWECESCKELEVLGSASEIEAKGKCELPDLHKEYLDDIGFSCKCGGQMKHLPEVLDGWFESGSMPYGQFHYPFERSEHFESHFPCDFIVEYTAQIRGWFYVMHVLATGLFDKPAFRNCMVHGTLLAADGKKMSKSQKNYTDPLALLDSYGADAFRAYLLSSNAVQMADLAFKDEGIENMVRTINLPLWNALLFFSTYAEIDGIDSTELGVAPKDLPLSEVDTFILSELELLIKRITEQLDQYLINEAAKELPEFLDTLNNWFIRRSRQRVWASEPRGSDKMVFYNVLYRVLSRFTQVLAPFCPFLAESLWERLGYTESVHLSNWPTVDESLIDLELSKEISCVRKIITAGLAIRARERIRVRQPLSTLRVAQRTKIELGPYLDYIREELNVKTVEILENPDEIAQRIGKPNAQLIGPKLGKATQEVIKLAKEGTFTVNADETISVGNYTLQKEEMEICFVGKDNLIVESTSDAVVALNTVLTPELEMEGYARDLVRQIQELRKDAELNISDRIELSIQGADDLLSAHGSYICQETLSEDLLPLMSNPLISRTLEVGERNVEVLLRKVPLDNNPRGRGAGL